MARVFSTAVAPLGDVLDWTRLERFRTAWRVETSQRVPLPPPGEGGDAAATADPVRQWAESVPEAVTLCLGSANVLCRCLALPTTEPAELGDMAALQLDKLLPLPAEEMSLGYEVLAQDEASTLVLACGVPTAVLDTYAERFGRERDRVARVDLGALACARLLADARLAGDAGREAVLLDEGAHVTLLVLDDGLPVLVRSAGLATASEEEFVRTLRLSLLQAEVERGSRPLGAIALISARPAAEVLRTRLSKVFGGAVRVLSPEAVGPLSRGAALRTAENAPGLLDLTPAAWRSAVSAQRFRRRLRRVLAAGLCVWGLLATVLYGGPTLLERQALRLEERIRVLEPSARAVRDVRNRVRMIQAYMDRERSPLEMLREISVLLPPGIDLASFRYRREEQRLSVQGTAQSTPLVYTFKQQVDASPLFSESTLVSGPTINPRTRGADFELLIVFKQETP